MKKHQEQTKSEEDDRAMRNIRWRAHHTILSVCEWLNTETSLCDFRRKHFTHLYHLVCDVEQVDDGQTICCSDPQLMEGGESGLSKPSALLIKAGGQ